LSSSFIDLEFFEVYGYLHIELMKIDWDYYSATSTGKLKGFSKGNKFYPSGYKYWQTLGAFVLLRLWRLKRHNF